MLIFDLDGTVIDSEHRKLTRADGTLDLDHWRENCTREKIFRDRLLPLSRIMRQSIRAGNRVIVCTSRVMSGADHHYLRFHHLMPRVLISRDPNDTRADGAFKLAKLTNSFSRAQLNGAVMFDDAESVRAALRPLGIRVIDPEPINKRLYRGAR